MISREQLISAIEEELVKADQATNNENFNRHMHAIHSLSGLVEYEVGNTQSVRVNRSNHITPQPSASKSKVTISDEEIRKMGGKVSQSSKTNTQDNLLSTDDGVGNGDSIFDF